MSHLSNSFRRAVPADAADDSSALLAHKQRARRLEAAGQQWVAAMAAAARAGAEVKSLLEEMAGLPMTADEISKSMISKVRGH